MKSKLFYSCAILALRAMSISAVEKPNIVVIYTDDMGIGDLSCYNSGWVQTPNIDKLASEGIKFNKYYSASPVSSPSRVSITTGMFPTEWGINTWLQWVEGDKRCEQFDYLDPAAPSMARELRKVGYKTAHIGKWHMGGGRDVYDAPNIPLYGFDEYTTTYDGPDPDPLITGSGWIWGKQDSIKRWERTGYFVDKTIAFMKKHKGTPCFVNLWPDDMHEPWVPSAEYYDNKKSWTSKANYLKVLKAYDEEIGRFVKELKENGLWENTLLIFTSDNGAFPTFDNLRSNGHRGTKVSLYEGGINMPFIVCWPNKIPKGKVDNKTILSSVDLFPTFCAITGAKMPSGFHYGGEDMSKALLGIKSLNRKKDLVWDHGRNKYFGRPPQLHQQSPHLAIRRGDFKLLINSDKTRLELYKLDEDPNETTNVASKYPKLCDELSQAVIDWYFSRRKIRK